MTGLAKATLQAIAADEQGTELGAPVPVQFNPSTLRFQLQNVVEGGESRGRQKRQHLGQSSTTLSMDLVFDTADEGSTDSPVSVRDKTAAVERFLLPAEEGDDAPPKARFQWGSLIFDGVIDSLSMEVELFSADGVPLRAKLQVTIREQDPEYQFLSRGSGAAGGAAPPAPGEPGPGALGFGASASASLGASLSAGASFSAGASLSAGASFSAGARVGVALEGESAAGFSARMGLDAASWRAVAGSVDDPLSLSAGAELSLPGVAASGGIGVHVGGGFAASAGASIDASIEASVGLSASAGLSAGASLGASAGLSAGASIGGSVGGAIQSGLALSAAGGAAAAIELVTDARSRAAAAVARASFPKATPPPALPSPSGTPAPSGVVRSAQALVTRAGTEPRAPLRRDARTGGARPSTPRGQSASATPVRPPRADARAASYGFGVPLRPRRAVGGAVQRAVVHDEPIGTVRRRGADAAPESLDPTTPRWEALPASPSAVDLSREARACGCRCTGPCHHRRKR